MCSVEESKTNLSYFASQFTGTMSRDFVKAFTVHYNGHVSGPSSICQDFLIFDLSMSIFWILLLLGSHFLMHKEEPMYTVPYIRVERF